MTFLYMFCIGQMITDNASKMLCYISFLSAKFRYFCVKYFKTTDIVLKIFCICLTLVKRFLILCPKNFVDVLDWLKKITYSVSKKFVYIINYVAYFKHRILKYSFANVSH